MNIATKLLTGAAAIAAFAVPAAAQYQQPYPQTYPQTYPQQTYPQQGYPQQGYGYPQQGGIGGIINQLLGNRYNVSDRTRVTQCATAAQAQAAAQFGRRGGYNQGAPYGNAYGYNAQTARVTAITNVERRAYGQLRVTGMMSSGMNAYRNQGYGNQGYGNQGYANAASDLTFRCNVDVRGAVTNVRVSRNNNGYRR